MTVWISQPSCYSWIEITTRYFSLTEEVSTIQKPNFIFPDNIKDLLFLIHLFRRSRISTTKSTSVMSKNGTTINGTPKNDGRSSKSHASETKASKGKKRERTSPSPTTKTHTLTSNSQNHGSGGGGNIYTHPPHGSVHLLALTSFTNQAFNFNG